ncbi:unnamed protein product [Schistosoma mattheei]|uniref:Uncharacterized protein n=1 Tax=Schistosoma mattheei TaxID=31246 RepID=A0A183PKE6_9TREM|nr:unnamed protein product [Schistosoma mattheei]
MSSPKRRCFRQRNASESSTEDEIVEGEKSGESSGLEEYEKEELTRQNDLKERDAFVKRLVDRDQQQTKGVSSRSASKHEEALRKITSGEVSREEMIAELRKASRRTYLRKRQSDKLADLQAEIQDEELFFENEELTEKEKAELLYKKTILAVAKSHQQAGELENIFRYYIPTEEKRPEDHELKGSESKLNDEGKRWEQEHLSSALYSFGAKDKVEQEVCSLCYYFLRSF